MKADLQLPKAIGLILLYLVMQAWNMFRNLSLGCSVDDTNFASTEASGVPNGNGATNSYQAMPVRRVYGTWVANGKEAYDETKYKA